MDLVRVQWIAAEVRAVTFNVCGFDDLASIAIATALYGTHRSMSLDMWIDCTDLDVEPYNGLLDALATCKGVHVRGNFALRVVPDDRVHIRALTTALCLRLENDEGASRFRIPSPP